MQTGGGIRKHWPSNMRLNFCITVWTLGRFLKLRSGFKVLDDGLKLFVARFSTFTTSTCSFFFSYSSIFRSISPTPSPSLPALELRPSIGQTDYNHPGNFDFVQKSSSGAPPLQEFFLLRLQLLKQLPLVSFFALLQLVVEKLKFFF